MKTISGKDAVDIAGRSPPFFFLNFDITVFLVGFTGFSFRKLLWEQQFDFRKFGPQPVFFIGRSSGIGVFFVGFDKGHAFVGKQT
jgi:hypothetical protein